MAMSASSIVSRLKAKYLAAKGEPLGDEHSLLAMLAESVVEEMTEEGEVTVNGTTSSGSPGGPLLIVNQPGTIT